MRFLLHTCAQPAEDLALEEAIQLGLEEGASPPTWRLWQATAPAVILGTGQEHEKEVDLPAARAAGVPVLRRHSGGGAVLIGPGAINYSGFFFIKDLPGAETITGAMQAGLRPVIAALKTLGVEATYAGLSDLVVTGNPDAQARKIAGHAQARKRTSVLVHGTLLADPAWELLEKVLRFPTRPPEYRAARGHRAFLTSLRGLGAPHTMHAFAQAMAAAIQAGTPAAHPEPAELSKAAALLADKYARAEWNLRR